MDLGSLRSLALDLNFVAHGVPATVTRPAPDNTPITTSGIWLAPVAESVPYGTDFQRREPRRVLAVKRADVVTLPRGTVITAPEKLGGADKTWRVDGLEREIDAYYWRAIVVLD